MFAARIAVNLFSNVAVFLWVERLRRECKCSDSWRRTALLATVPAAVVLGLFAAFLPGYLEPQGTLKDLAYVAYYILTAFNLVTMFWYASELSRKSSTAPDGCECSAGWGRRFARAWPLVMLAVWLAGAIANLATTMDAFRCARYCLVTKTELRAIAKNRKRYRGKMSPASRLR